MKWVDLTDEAKGVIEWVVSPITNFRQTIEIKIGETFHRKCPKFCGDHGEPIGDINIPITKELFQEILKYVKQTEDMQYEEKTDRLIFRLKDGVEV